MNVAGSGRVGSSFSIRVAQNNVLGWRWTVEKEHDGFFEHVASGRSLVVPERLRTLDHGRPWRDDQFAACRVSSSRDMSR